MTEKSGKTLKITQIRSTIGRGRKQAAVIRGLGLRRIRHTVELPDTPETRGMIFKVSHMVSVTE
jgi:large subunit ribosomal protein L30